MIIKFLVPGSAVSRLKKLALGSQLVKTQI